MVTKRILWFCAVMLCLAGYAVNAQISGVVDITGAGARAEGVGGAFIGVADDATAIVWNPAGLTQLERVEASFVGRQIFETFKDADQSLDDKSSHFNFNFGSIAFPVDLGGKKITFAVAFQNQVDLYTSSADASNSRNQNQRGRINSISPGFGIRVIPLLSLGASANIWTGTSNYKETDQGTGNLTFGYKDTWSGFNLQFGALADFSALAGGGIPLRLGVSFRTPFEMNDKYTFLSSSGGDTWKWQFPAMVGFGVSYRFGENLIVSADYEIRKFGKAKIKGPDIGGVGVNDIPFSDSKKDVNPIRVGAEYLVVTSDLVIPIRAGFKTVPTLYANRDALFNPTDQTSGSAFSVGSGIIFKKFAIDVAATMSSFKQTQTGASTAKTSKITVSSSVIVYF